jgi:hypothetical protein
VARADEESGNPTAPDDESGVARADEESGNPTAPDDESGAARADEESGNPTAPDDESGAARADEASGSTRFRGGNATELAELVHHVSCLRVAARKQPQQTGGRS